MLRFNSTKEVLPGGPVSRVADVKKISNGAGTISWTKTTSTIAGIGFFAAVFETARRILQHPPLADGDTGFLGLE